MVEFYDKEALMGREDEYAEFFKQPKRKYEVSDKFNLTRAEAELLLEVLSNEGLIRNTSVGWQWI